jgi:hypothetical protein
MMVAAAAVYVGEIKGKREVGHFPSERRWG